MTTHEVISAFIDNEPFEATALAEALATPDGRALLIDLIALRDVAQPEDAVMVPTKVRRTRGPLVWVAAAGIVLAAIGGHQIGVRRGAAANDPPPATVVVKAGEWNSVSSGGLR